MDPPGYSSSSHKTLLPQDLPKQAGQVEMAIRLGHLLVNAKDTKGITPLHVACSSGGEQVIQYLIDNGADVNARVIHLCIVGVNGRNEA